METSNCDAKNAVVHTQNDRSYLGPIETCYSGPEDAVFHGKSTGGVLDRQGLVILVVKPLYCMYKTTGEGWNPYSLDTLLLGRQLCVLKSTDEVWDPYRLVIMMQITLFCMHKTTGEVWDP